MNNFLILNSKDVIEKSYWQLQKEERFHEWVNPSLLNHGDLKKMDMKAHITKSSSKVEWMGA